MNKKHRAFCIFTFTQFTVYVFHKQTSVLYISTETKCLIELNKLNGLS